MGEFPGGGVAARVGADIDVEVVDVFAGVEVMRIVHGVALDADVETSKVGDDDLFAVQEVVAHHFAQFGEHEDDVGGFGGTVARDFFGELCKSYAAGLAGAGVVAVVVPLLFKGTNYCHDYFTVFGFTGFTLCRLLIFFYLRVKPRFHIGFTFFASGNGQKFT